MAHGAVTLAIDSAFDHVFLVGAAVRRIAVVGGLDDGAANQVELAVVEGVNNAIEHAYGGRAGQRVDIAVRLDDRCLTVDIADRGLPMAWELACAAAAARLDADPLADGGRGLLIMREVMDAVDYHSDGGTNVLRLVKHIDADADRRAPAVAARGRSRHVPR